MLVIKLYNQREISQNFGIKDQVLIPTKTGIILIPLKIVRSNPDQVILTMTNSDDDDSDGIIDQFGDDLMGDAEDRKKLMTAKSVA